MGGRTAYRRSGRSLALLALVVLLAGPAGAGVGTYRAGDAPRATSTTSPRGPFEIAAAYAPPAGVRPVGPLPSGTPLTVDVALEDRDPGGLAEEIVLEYTPGTPEYRNYLTPSEIAALYGPSESTYDAAADYFLAQGLTVGRSPDLTLLTLQGSAADVGRAFGTSFELFAGPDGEFYEPTTPAVLPGTIPWAGAVGLDNATVARPAVTAPAAGPSPPATTPSAGCATSPWLTPCLAWAAYNVTSLLAAGDNGTGYRIGIVDAYDAEEPQPQLASDFATFEKDYDLPRSNLSFVYATPSGNVLNTTDTGWATEDALDIEWSHALAPGASIVDALSADTDPGLYGSVDYLVSHDSVDVISMSWGENDVGIYNAYAGSCPSACNASSDGSYETLHPVLEDAAAEGIGLFSASGDCGAADGTSGLSTNYPASDPYVTGVGGTNLDENDTTGQWISESGWAGNSSGATSPGCINQGGSGGGFAPFSRPVWQNASGFPSTEAFRGVPDVAAVAGTPGAEMIVGGSSITEGGTSLACPIWAGLAADADRLAHGRLGFLDPSLYAAARSPTARSGFHDETQGWNGYDAGPGWDPVTGLGSPNAGALLPHLAASAVAAPGLSVELLATPRYGPAPLTVTFTVSATGGTGTFTSEDIDFGDGTSALVTNGRASHTYPSDGVFVATASAFDSAGNSSTSPAVLVDVGGGLLAVTLSAAPTRPATGANVTFTAQVTGDGSKFLYTFEFGDGTYLDLTNRSTVTHAYGSAGGWCAQVIAQDLDVPAHAGESAPVPVAVGGANAPSCVSSPPINASLSVFPTARDAPGDLLLDPTVAGGTGPLTVRYSSSDPYANACGCGIFSGSGAETVSANVTDALDGSANATADVTIYPALTGAFTASVLAGPAPLTVRFAVALSGGHLADANATRWTFGDGTNATGASVTHTFTAVGQFVTLGVADDGTGGIASSAFLLDVYASAAPLATVLTAQVTPAVDVPAGDPVHYAANVTGSVGPYLLRWGLGENASAFGASVTESYAYEPCEGACVWNITLAAIGAGGSVVTARIPLADPVLGNATALDVDLTDYGESGTTPFTFIGSAPAGGMPDASVSWAFGDGGSASGPSAVHTYEIPGNYTVVVTATDATGEHLTLTRAVVVTGPARYAPSVEGGPNVSAGYGPLSVGFTATGLGGEGGPYAFSWAFGDGAIGSGPVVDHTYTTPGSYNATVTVVDHLGDAANVTYPITVWALATVALDVSGVPASLRASGSFRLEVHETLVCPADPAPTCGSAFPPLRYEIAPSGLGAPLELNGTGSALGKASAWTNETLLAPSTPGSYTVWIWTRYPGFNGSTAAPLPMTTAAATSSGGLGLGPYDVTLLLAAVLFLLAVVILRRARRARPRDPAAPPAPPHEPPIP